MTAPSAPHRSGTKDAGLPGILRRAPPAWSGTAALSGRTLEPARDLACVARLLRVPARRLRVGCAA